MPDQTLTGDHRGQRGARIGQPGRALGHHVQDVDQDVVQRPEQRVEQDAPGQRAHDLGNDVRQQDQAAQDRSPARQVVEQQRRAQPEGELEDFREERELGGGDDRASEEVVAPQIDVVLQADEGAFAHADDVEEAQVQGAYERIADQPEQQQRCRQEEQPGDRPVAAQNALGRFEPAGAGRDRQRPDSCDRLLSSHGLALSPCGTLLLAFGAELLERLDGPGVRRRERVLDRLAAQDLAEHVGQEVRVVQGVDLRRLAGPDRSCPGSRSGRWRSSSSCR